MKRSGRDEAASFLKLEFDVLHRRIEVLERKRADRSTAFIAGFGLIGGAFAFVSVTGFVVDNGYVVGALFAIVLFIGWGIMRQSTFAAIQIVLLYRRAGRVRVYFQYASPGIARYLPWAPGDDTPPFRDSRAYSTFDPNDTVVKALNCVSGAAIPLSFGPGDIRAISAGLVFALLVFLGQMIWIRAAVGSADREASKPYNVRFPRRSLKGASDEGGGHW